MSWDRKVTIKTPKELELMRDAGRINAEALIACFAAIVPGNTTADVNTAAEAVFKNYGVYSPASASVLMKNWYTGFRGNVNLKRVILCRLTAAQYTKVL